MLTLARSDFNRLVHIENSKVEERSWHFLHMDPEILLLGNWYRPGATEHDAYAALQEEMGAHVLEATGIILSGDLNVHHARWLRFSNGNTVQGSDLKAVSTIWVSNNLSTSLRDKNICLICASQMLLEQKCEWDLMLRIINI